MHLMCIAAYQSIEGLFENQLLLAVTFEPLNCATFAMG